ncbi:MAG: hypothetical protein E6Q97_20700 [Desulfurellales bacterium]|nr:MAG: hypothetical protein E6Q97_20700 [Desulfurellales bacterium]
METKTPKTPLIKSLSDAALHDHYWSCRELAYNNMQMVGYCGRRGVDKLGRQMGWLMKQIDICEAVARQRKISLARDVSVVPEKPSSHACRSSTTADGNGAFCTVCGETLA